MLINNKLFFQRLIFIHKNCSEEYSASKYEMENMGCH